MNIDTVITQLRTYAPIFNNNVAGAADYAKGLETVVSLPLPSCFVYPLEDAVEENSGMGGSLHQEVHERIAVVVELDNTTDRRGQSSVTSVEAIKYGIFKAILNWNPSGFGRAGQGLRYNGGHLLGMDRERIFWQFDFYLTATITQTDGFIPSAQYLQTISITDTVHPPLVIGLQVDNQLTALATLGFTGVH
jgi:hypothetical protein